MTGDLYQNALLALAKDATYAGRPEGATKDARADNPLCGDRVILHAAIEDGRVVRLGHTVRGCAVCKAATSLLCTRAPFDRAGLAAYGQELAAVLAGEPGPEDLAPLRPAASHRSRHDCVLLATRAAEALWVD